MKNKLSVIATKLLLAMACLSHSANAGEYATFYHAICSPELDFFQISRVDYDLNEEHPIQENETPMDYVKRVLGSQNVFTATKGRNTKECQVAENHISVKIEYDKVGPPTSGMCGAAYPGKFILTQNHKKKFEVPFAGFCASEEPMVIRVTPHGFKHCYSYRECKYQSLNSSKNYKKRNK